MSSFVYNGFTVHRVSYEFGVIREQAKVRVNVAGSSGTGNGVGERSEDWKRLVLDKLVYPSDDQTVLDVPSKEWGEEELFTRLHAADKTASRSGHESVGLSEFAHVGRQVFSAKFDVLKNGRHFGKLFHQMLGNVDVALYETEQFARGDVIDELLSGVGSVDAEVSVVVGFQKGLDERRFGHGLSPVALPDGNDAVAQMFEIVLLEESFSQSGGGVSVADVSGGGFGARMPVPVATVELIDSASLGVKTVHGQAVSTQTNFAIVKGCLKNVAAQKLHPAEPSLSRFAHVFDGRRTELIFLETSDRSTDGHVLGDAVQVQSVGVVALNPLAEFSRATGLSVSDARESSSVISVEHQSGSSYEVGAE